MKFDLLFAVSPNTACNVSFMSTVHISSAIVILKVV